jgi:hypothetical protein
MQLLSSQHVCRCVLRTGKVHAMPGKQRGRQRLDRQRLPVLCWPVRVLQDQGHGGSRELHGEPERGHDVQDTYIQRAREPAGSSGCPGDTPVRVEHVLPVHHVQARHLLCTIRILQRGSTRTVPGPIRDLIQGEWRVQPQREHQLLPVQPVPARPVQVHGRAAGVHRLHFRDVPGRRWSHHVFIMPSRGRESGGAGDMPVVLARHVLSGQQHVHCVLGWQVQPRSRRELMPDVRGRILVWGWILFVQDMPRFHLELRRH